MKITSILKKLGWVKKHKKERTIHYGSQWVFVRPTLKKEANLLEKKEDEMKVVKQNHELTDNPETINPKLLWGIYN